MADRLTELLKDKRIIGKQPKKEKINYQWHDLIPFVMAEYNAKNKHRITGMTPYEARKPSNEADVKAAMELVATHGVKFPPLRVGDTVRMLLKKKLGHKEFMDAFKPGKQKVVEITESLGQKFYTLSDKRDYIRSDLVKMIN
jgi:hypothetical protein